MNKYDVVVIGGGPAGLAAAIKAHENNASVLLIEREAQLGGILKQCIHDGFGLHRFNEKLSGPEYADRFINKLLEENIPYQLLSFVSHIEKNNNEYILTVVSRDGLEKIIANNIIFATGCRERSAKQVFIHGTRPFGVLTAGACQHLVNIEGVLPTKRCCILGSGDIGLIMARRLTLEGAKVLGVYEIKPTVSGLMRNVQQCLYDFNIPLHLSKTVTRTFGYERLEAIEVASVDNKMKVIEGTQEIIKCDALILSVGLIPENELTETVGVKLDGRAKGAICDNNFETNIDHIFTCGNATHVNDLVDYVSLSAEIAGDAASIKNKNKRELVNIEVKGKVLYLVPEMLDINNLKEKTIMFFRSNDVLKNVNVKISVDDHEVFNKKYINLKPPEMEKIDVEFGEVKKDSKIIFEID